MSFSQKKAVKQLAIDAGGFSTAGIKATNQDAFALKINKGISLYLKGHVAVIADGVSSANFAAQASQMSVCHFIEEYLATPKSWSVSKSAASVIRSLNSWLYSRTLVKTYDNVEQQWYSTFSALILKNQTAHIFHLGDSQIAKLDQDGYQVLTTAHANSNGVLNRAIGTSSHAKVDYSTIDLCFGDIYLLTSDGLHDYLAKDFIVETINSNNNLEKASQLLVDQALINGSQDNATCLIIKVNCVTSTDLKKTMGLQQHRIIPPALPINAMLDHYKIINAIQETARSHIYLAIDLQTQHQVVIKVPSLNFADDTTYINNFIKEGWIGSQLDHQGLMKIIPQTHNSCFLYHVCEYVAGITLAKWIETTSKPTQEIAIALLSQMINAIRALQRMDIIHCDLKPDNFIINQSSQVTLIDYGSCKIGSIDEANTYHGVGTLTYSAPELFQGNSPTHISDIFSLASIFYQILTKQMPYQSITSLSDIPKPDTLWRYKSVTAYRQDLTANIDTPLRNALHVDPAHRTDSLSELYSSMLQTTTVKTLRTTPPPFIERKPELFWKLMSLFLLIIFILSLISK